MKPYSIVMWLSCLALIFLSSRIQANTYKDSVQNEINELTVQLDTASDNSKLDILFELNWLYGDFGNFSKQLEVLLNGKSLADSIQDANYSSDFRYALSVFYNRQEQQTKALENAMEAIHMYQTLKDSVGIAAAAHRIGIIYLSVNLDSANSYASLSYRIRSTLSRPYPFAASSNSLGLVLIRQDSTQRALELFNQALEAWQSINDLEGASIAYGNIGTAYKNQNDFNKAIFNYQKSLEYARKSNALTFIKETSIQLSKLYEQMGNSDSSLKYLHEFIDAKDSIFNENSRSKMLGLEAKFKNLEKEKLILQQESELKNHKLRQLVLLIAIGLGVLILVIIFYSFIQKKKANILLLEQKVQIEEQNEELNQQNEEILSISERVEAQNTVLSRQNKDINDSIDYAQKIQSAILPDLEEFKDHFSEHHLFYQPKETVSGDFYWMDMVENQLIWAVVDCTGHGVPGAMMSMLAYNGLNKIIVENKVTSPDKILDNLTSHIIGVLGKKSGEESLSDGLDISICCLDTKTKEFSFSGAYQSCYIIDDSEFVEFKGTRRPVGKFDIKVERPYQLHKLESISNKWIFLSSDGILDQFGGPKEKKFGHKNFKNLIQTIPTAPNKSNILDTAFNDWKLKLDQVDDICVLAIKFV